MTDIIVTTAEKADQMIEEAVREILDGQEDVTKDAFDNLVEKTYNALVTSSTNFRGEPQVEFDYDDIQETLDGIMEDEFSAYEEANAS